MSNNLLLQTLGGESGCKSFSKSFYDRVAASNELRTLFPGKTLRCATEEFAAFLVQFLGGDQSLTQYRWWLSLRESHARFSITEGQRATWLQLMQETITSTVTDLRLQRELVQFFEVGSSYLVGRNEAEVHHPELRSRWELQKELDFLIECLVNQRDAEAIAIASKFVPQSAVFVGILARMMDADRDALVAFVSQSIENDDRLLENRFNGRTLLHFAAGSSSLSVVRLLIGSGVDPDILDGGGHSPLFRVASTPRTERGVKVVNDLVGAGANVNHCGGVTKSTPLHEAARRGTVPVAEALLAAGASPRSRDKNGSTPLDRAIKLRRHEMAAFLAKL